MVWSKEWINYLNLEAPTDPEDVGSRKQPSGKIDVYPLQFANCDRLENNEVVYIFDEVGSGKTISAGLMALHYLYNHPKVDGSHENDVLVITVNAVVKTGQFQRDLLKLPFEALGLWNDRVTVINNHNCNIKKHHGNWGLVIIDEAHKFLNKNNRMNQKLCGYKINHCSDGETKKTKVPNQVRAERVVFLTATPVKNEKTDLYVYEGIARALIYQELPEDQYDDVPWIDKLCTSKRKQSDPNNPDLICSRFCKISPVTRYFKDTIRALQTDEMKKTGPRRLWADVWNYKYEWEDKDSILLDNINKEFCKDKSRNRFVVFVRYVEGEAKKLEKFLLSKGFRESLIKEHESQIYNHN